MYNTTSTLAYFAHLGLLRAPPQLYLPPILVRKKLESEVEDLRAALESEQVMRKQLEKKKLDIKPTTPEVTQTKASPEEIKKFQDEIAVIKVCIFDLKLKYRPTQKNLFCESSGFM